MQGTPKRHLNELNQNTAARTLANSPRGLHTSLEGGLNDLALLNIGTPPGAKKEKEVATDLMIEYVDVWTVLRNVLVKEIFMIDMNIE